MKPALILLAVLVAVGAVLWLHDRATRHTRAAAPTEDPGTGAASSPAPRADACTNNNCLLHATCPSEERLNGLCATSEPVYYDDEELDTFRDRPADDYTDAELEQWRDVLYTLLPADIAGWQHSLARRGLRLPNALHDELLMLLGEASTQKPDAQNASDL